jgi:hypothetical protein
MEDKLYDDGDIIRYYRNTFNKIKRTRKRTYVDPRDYMIALLHYKFGYTEEVLAMIFGPMHRTSVNHCKKNPYYSFKYNDSVFAENTIELREKFPYTFPDPKENSAPPGRKYRVTLKLTPEEHAILAKISKRRGERTDVTGRILLIKYLKQYFV